MVARFVGQGRLVPVEAIGADGTDRVVVRVRAGRRLVLPGSAAPGPAWLCLQQGNVAEGADGLPATVTASRFEGGCHLVSAVLGGVAEGGEVELRSATRRAPGEALEIRLTSGWVIRPRDGAA